MEHTSCPSSRNTASRGTGSNYAALEPSEILRLAADLVRCVENDQLVRAKLILKNLNAEDRASVVKTRIGDGNASLFLAAQLGKVQFVNFLLDEGHADIEQKGTYEVAEDRSRHQVSPLWCAAVTNRLEVVRALTCHGADINAPSDTQSTPVRSACYMTNTDVVRFLVDNGADIHRPNMNGGTCLINSVQSAELCTFLLEHGASVNAHDNSGNLALHYAIREGRLETVKLLLKNGSDAYYRNDFGDDAIQSASLRGYAEILEYLLEELRPGMARAVEAYELLGTNAVDEKHDIDSAIRFWKTAMSMRNGCSKFDHDARMRAEQQLPNPAYCNAREPSNLGELCAMAQSPDRVYMHALLLRERILGQTHKDTIFGLMYRGAVYADTREYQRCVDLWKYAFRLRHAQHALLTHEYLFTLQALCKLFWEIFEENSGGVNGRSTAGDFEDGEGDVVLRSAGANSVRFCDVLEVLEMTVAEVHTAKAMLHTTEECTDRQNELLIMLQLTLHLVQLLCCLHKTTDERLIFYRLVHRLVRVDVRLLDGRTLLHLAIDQHTSSVSDEFYSPFPSARVARVLLVCGASTHDVDEAGNTALHTCQQGFAGGINALSRTELISIAGQLLSNGSHVDAVNKAGIAPIDSLGQHLPTFNRVAYTSLKCIAARVIRKYNVPYDDGSIPKSLTKFIVMH